MAYVVPRRWELPRLPRLPRLRWYPRDAYVSVAQILDPQVQRVELLRIIDDGAFRIIVVVNAFLGFFAGAYTLFAMNMAKPMIQIVYYYDRDSVELPSMDQAHEVILRVSIYLGTIIGQVGFGMLADLYGRRTLYGYELICVICGTLFNAVASDGEQSMSFIAMLCASRFLIGVGVGGDYPVSATITSEFAPTRHRARMLAVVFFAQPCGYLAAGLVALVVASRGRAAMDRDMRACTDVCRQEVDSAWRWVVGVGAIFSALAIGLRRTIPESPRYTLEVLNNHRSAHSDARLLNGEAWDDIQQDHGGLALRDVSGGEPRGGGGAALRVATGIDQYEEEQRLAQLFESRWRRFWAGFRRHFGRERLWVPLVGVSLSWLLWDLAFYALGASSHDVLGKIWNSQDVRVYEDLYQNAWHSLVTVSPGGIVGGLVMIYLVKDHSLRRIQLNAFLVLTALFLMTGLVLRFVDHDSVTPPAVILYFLCQLAFEVGPNFTTFIIPAELFPTTHRAFAHGIAAASGKLGAVVTQSYYEYVFFEDGSATDGRWDSKDDGDEGIRWLGSVIMAMMGFMVAGAVVTCFLVPETRWRNREPMVLEHLALVGGTREQEVRDGQGNPSAEVMRVRNNDGTFRELPAMQPGNLPAEEPNGHAVA